MRHHKSIRSSLPSNFAVIKGVEVNAGVQGIHPTLQTILLLVSVHALHMRTTQNPNLLHFFQAIVNICYG